MIKCCEGFRYSDQKQTRVFLLVILVSQDIMDYLFMNLQCVKAVGNENKNSIKKTL